MTSQLGPSMAPRQVICLLILLVLVSCYHHNFDNPYDPDNIKDDIRQRTGTFRLAAGNDSLSLYDIINDTLGDTSSLDIGATVTYHDPDYTVRLYCMGGVRHTSCGGIRIGTGDSAPVAGYSDSISYTAQYSNSAGCHLVGSAPSQIWLLCRDGVHFCKVILDSFLINPSSYTGYFTYTLNLDPNDTDFKKN